MLFKARSFAAKSMKKLFLPTTIIILMLLSSCQIFTPAQTKLEVQISADNRQVQLKVDPGTTVQEALTSSGITLQPLDRVEPGLSTIISTNLSVKVTRVEEEFQVEESVLPFENQTVKNESLPEGQSILIQAGVNGKLSSTYRVVKENGVIVSRTLVKTDTLVEAKPEIMMIGVQSPFTSTPINGILAYITSSNAWIMENTTGNRRPVVTTGDLDGRIFSISPDRKWLLFSRSISTDNSSKNINSLWIVNLEETDPSPKSLGVNNVVLFADWIPGKSRTIAYSTVEPRDTAPGWQANNDLIFLSFDENGKTVSQQTILDTNAGGLYGWWGTTFEFSPDGQKIAFARPDALGFVNQKDKTAEVALNVIPYQTKSDWAWVPGIRWSPDGNILFSILHGSEDQSLPSESSTEFDLTAIISSGNEPIRLVQNSGMFSYSVPSPEDEKGKYLVAFLSAILTDQSETSRYDLRIMDRDGSNQKKLFPGEGVQGINPQFPVWEPGSGSDGNYTLGFIAQGNIMLVSTTTGALSQLTGDGSVSKIDWR